MREDSPAAPLAPVLTTSLRTPLLTETLDPASILAVEDRDTILVEVRDTTLVVEDKGTILEEDKDTILEVVEVRDTTPEVTPATLSLSAMRTTNRTGHQVSVPSSPLSDDQPGRWRVVQQGRASPASLSRRPLWRRLRLQPWRWRWRLSASGARWEIGLVTKPHIVRVGGKFNRPDNN